MVRGESVTPQCPVLLVLQVLSDGEDVLPRSTEIAGENVAVRLGQQVGEFVDLARKLRVDVVGLGRGAGAIEEGGPADGVAPAAVEDGGRRGVRDGGGEDEGLGAVHAAGGRARAAREGGRVDDDDRSGVRVGAWLGLGEGLLLLEAVVAPDGGEEAAGRLAARKRMRAHPR